MLMGRCGMWVFLFYFVGRDVSVVGRSGDRICQCWFLVSICVRSGPKLRFTVILCLDLYVSGKGGILYIGLTYLEGLSLWYLDSLLCEMQCEDLDVPFRARLILEISFEVTRLKL
jgi:hypothetical protein